MRTVIVVVAYEAEGCIEQLLDRIPPEVGGRAPRILVSDDASTDRTAIMAEAWAGRNPTRQVTVVRQPRNLGYGGNQKFCFDWAERNGAEVTVLLHGDEQYPPELMAELVEPVLAGDADAAYGSRMMHSGGAREGGMPINRFVGNVALSRLFNTLAGTGFTEWFSGFRAYRTVDLAEMDLRTLPDGFDFDMAITLRLVEMGRSVVEVPIPTHYGEELSRVPLLRTGLADIGHAAASRWRSLRRGRPARP